MQTGSNKSLTKKQEPAKRGQPIDNLWVSSLFGFSFWTVKATDRQR
jgi:hypothetical protein